MGIFDRLIQLTRYNQEVNLPPPPITKSFRDMDLIKGRAVQEPKAVTENPFLLLDALGYKDSPSSISYNTLKQMAVKDAVIASIITTRINQVSNFTKPSRFSKDGLGFEIKTRDPNKVPDKKEKDIILAIELFLENCGFDDDNNRDSFDDFVRKVIRDSLTYDQCAFEIVSDKLGRPASFYAVDAASIRFATEKFVPSVFMEISEPKKNQEVKWVQVIDNMVVSWFTNNELAFGVRNPRSDINVEPYGFSELEQLIHQITSHLYAEEYNKRYFSQGGTTKGILNVKTSLTNPASLEQFEAFKRQWKAQVSGMTGAWKTPVISAPEGLEYISVNQSNREMEFEKWMNYLINIACAVFQIDPAEVNFPNNGGVGGTGGGVFEGGNEARLKNSKDKGLRPLLRFLESLINKFLISRFSNEYTFNFVGIDAKTDKEKVDLDAQAVKVYKTVNEIRKEHDMESIDSGDVILDPSYINMVNQAKMMEQQQGMMGGAEEGVDTDDENMEETEGENLMEDDEGEDENFDFGFNDTDIDEEWENEENEEDEEEKNLKKSSELSVMEIILK